MKSDIEILAELQDELLNRLTCGDNCGPFMAAVVAPDGWVVARAANSVVKDGCSHRHAEMNAIAAAEKAFGTWDLGPYNLTLYTTSEPCLMCVGGILWSGIRRVVYGTDSKTVEAITGFDEGFKNGWQEEFKKRGIAVTGPLDVERGAKVLRAYANPVYSPTRGKEAKE